MADNSDKRESPKQKNTFEKCLKCGKKGKFISSFKEMCNRCPICVVDETFETYKVSQ